MRATLWRSSVAIFASLQKAVVGTPADAVISALAVLGMEADIHDQEVYE